jgi:hypothetical protein
MLYVNSDLDPPSGLGHRDEYGGQTNGLCGAGVPGHLSLQAVPHTATVPVRVELHDEEPAVDPVWEEVVEASFRRLSPVVLLTGFEGPPIRIALPDGDYRVRYCCSQMDQVDELEIQGSTARWATHLLQFWPAPPGPDRVVRQTSQIAALHHRNAQQTPPATTPAQQADAARREAEQRRRDEERFAPVGGDALRLVTLNRATAYWIADQAPSVQRLIAGVAAEQACRRARLSVDWVTSALAALRRGLPLPPPFTDPTQVDALLRAEPPANPQLHNVDVCNGRPVYADWLGTTGTPMRVAAVETIYAAAQEDPLRAALDAVWAAAVTWGDAYRGLLNRLPDRTDFLTRPRT